MIGKSKRIMGAFILSMLLTLSVFGVPEESKAVEMEGEKVVQQVNIDIEQYLGKSLQIIFENGRIVDPWEWNGEGVIDVGIFSESTSYNNIFEREFLSDYRSNIVQNALNFKVENNGEPIKYKINSGTIESPFDYSKVDLNKGNIIYLGNSSVSKNYNVVKLEAGKKYLLKGIMNNLLIEDEDGNNFFNTNFCIERANCNDDIAVILEPVKTGNYTISGNFLSDIYSGHLELIQVGVEKMTIQNSEIYHSYDKAVVYDTRNTKSLFTKMNVTRNYSIEMMRNYMFHARYVEESLVSDGDNFGYKYGRDSQTTWDFENQSVSTVLYPEKNSLAYVMKFITIDSGNLVSPNEKLNETFLFNTNQTHRPKIGDESKKELQELKVEDRKESEIGDPVDSFRGNFVDKKTLLSYSGDNALEFNLNYDSIANDSDALSSGFTHNFETKIKREENNLSILWNPNTISRFKKESEKWESTRKKDDIQIEETAHGYKVTEKENTYLFDLDGKILYQGNLNGKTLEYSYQGNLLTSVKNERKQVFYFEYEGGNLIKVRDEEDRELEFVYNSATNNLDKIIYPNKKKLVFNYEYLESDDVSYSKLSSMRFDNKMLVENIYNETGAIQIQKDAKGNQTEFIYDEWSDPLNITTTMINPDGSEITKTHNSLGQVIRETNERGFVSSFKYDLEGNKIEETDFKGNVISYEYDENGNVLKINNPNNTSVSYEYNDFGSVTKMTDVDSQVWFYEYNERNQLIKSVDKKGLIMTFDYDNSGNVVKQKTGNRTTYRNYDENGNLVKIELPNGDSSVNEYDLLGRQIATTLKDGKRIETVYDVQNNIIKQTHTDGSSVVYQYDSFGKKVRETNARGIETTFKYDLTGNLTSEKTGNRETTYKYDAMNRIISKSTSTGKTTYKYDKSGNLIKETNESGVAIKRTFNPNNLVVSETIGTSRTKYSYDNMGRLKIKTDPEGNIYKYGYYKSGLLAYVLSPSGNRTSYRYDKMGRQVKIVDPKGNVYQTVYNVYGEKVKEINPLGYVTTFGYDMNGRQKWVKNAKGEKTSFFYNSSGQLIITKNNRNQVVQRIFYNKAGRVSKMVDGNGNSVRMIYNKLGEVVVSYNAEGNLISKNKYNQYGEMVKTIDALNNEVVHTFDIQGNQIRTKDALGNTTNFFYREDGLLVKSVDANGTVSQNQYDDKGRLISNKIKTFENKYKFNKNDQVTLETMPGGTKLSYTYNPESQLSKRINARGEKTSYEYDANGNMVLETTKEGTTAYKYDVLNRLIKSESKGNIIEREYDELNRVVKKIQNGKEIGYEYDDLGHLVKIIYPDGKEVGYTYDVMGNMLSVTDWKDNVTAYEYNKNNQLVKTTQSNGVIETREYNVAGQLVALKSLKDEIVITHFTYEYDANGNIIKEVDVKNGKDHLYTYDKLGRLTNANENSYTYSATGNITSYQLTHNGETTSNKMTYNSDNQLNKINGNLASIDKDGNLLTYKLNGKTYVATYDSKNKMIQYGNMYFQYDSEGNRIGIRQTGNYGETESETSFVVDNDSDRLSRILLETKDGKDTYYVYGQGLISEHKDDQVNTYHFDYRGSTVAMTDENGAVIGEAEYDEYGTVLESSIVTRFMYNGQFGIENDENGLYYMRTRYYNLNMKKFMNRDVVVGDIVESQSLNRYAFVNGNPINYTDPFGMARETTENTQAKALGSADMETLHFVLDMIGMFPVVGELADAANVLLYVSEGNYKMASISALAMVPLIGNFATGGKLVAKIGGKIDTAYTATKKAITSGFGWFKKKTSGFWKEERGSLDISQFTANKTNRHFENKMQKHEDRISRGINPSKQENELAVARYGDIRNLKGPYASKGDNLEGHHTPSKEYLKMYNIKADDGIAVNMHRKRHQATTTYGSGVKRIPEYYETSPRDVLARDMRELRIINRKSGIDRGETNESVRSVIRMWNEHPSGLMKKT